MKTQSKRRTSILVGLALMGLSVNGYAAEVSATADVPTTAVSTESNGASEIHTINVTANRMALLDLDTPAAMDVITQKDLVNSGAKNAFDAVNMVPGVTSFSYGASGLEYGAMDSRVNIRGLERGSLVLVNGVPMNLNGKESESMTYLRPFLKQLEKAIPNIPVTMIDERFTSTLAQRTIIEAGIGKQRRREDKGLVDEVSAVIILQTYMSTPRF